MSVQVKVLKAFQGDCIWIRYGEEHFTNIIVDSGPSKFKDKFLDLISKIKELGENIDLLIFTHIDNDHIGGASKVLADYNVPCDCIKKIWINTATKVCEYFNLNESVSKDYVVDVENVNQEYTPRVANKLIDIIIDRNIEVEQMIMCNDIKKKNKIEFNNAEIIILSPTKDRLIKMVNEWEKYELNTQFSSEDWSEVDLDSIFTDDEYSKDTNKFNGSSIAFLFKYDDIKLALLGDSYSEVIADSLKCLVKDKKINVDLIKLSHHGSASNTNYDLLNKFDCSNYIVSTNGTNNNPDKRTIARIIKANSSNNINLYSNYNWWDNTSYFTKNDYDKYVNKNIINPIELGSDEIKVKEGLLISNE